MKLRAITTKTNPMITLLPKSNSSKEMKFLDKISKGLKKDTFQADIQAALIKHKPQPVHKKPSLLYMLYLDNNELRFWEKQPVTGKNDAERIQSALLRRNAINKVKERMQNRINEVIDIMIVE